MNSSRFRVRIEFKRIQTFLFAVPRLRAMLGANALLGETTRIELPKLVQRASGFSLSFPTPDTEAATAAGTTDDAASQIDWTKDDPTASYRKGVLTRDGGHFQAMFATAKDVENFIKAANSKIVETLPGILFDVRAEAWIGTGWVEQESLSQRAASVEFLFEPPTVATCELSGRGVAVDTVTLGKAPDETVFAVTAQVAQQFAKGKEFQHRNPAPKDWVSLLSPTWPLFDTAAADDLHDIAGGDGRYLALIHADGNSVGSRTPDYPEKISTLDQWLEAEAAVESFFHSMREAVLDAVGAALKTAIERVYGKSPPKWRPYQVLMLGGDDLLMVCAAELALPFVVAYAEELAQRNLRDGKPLGIGAGVVICKPTLPINTMHALAEELASSAKRLTRSALDPHISVVDWHVLSQAGTPNDLGAMRMRHDLLVYKVNNVIETVGVSRKPYRALSAQQSEGGSSPEIPSLQGLLAAADKMKHHKGARSQLRSLAEELLAGRRAAQLAFADLPDTLRAQLEGFNLGTPWLQLAGQSQTWTSCLGDLVEIAEIPRLGSSVALAAGGNS